jgi:RNA polymerase sigma-70 factor, ECF subfamily
MVGDIAVAEEAVQEACVVAVRRWPLDGVPESPSAWLVSTARHKALDALRREASRVAKEGQAVDAMSEGSVDMVETSHPDDDQLALIFACCHPALDQSVRVPLTLRSVCGLNTREIAHLYLMSEATMAQRLVRAKRKIRDAGIPLQLPAEDELQARLADVLEVVYLTYTEGHRASRGDALIREELCDEGIRLARELWRLMPSAPEVGGLLALLVLTDARRDARTDAEGRIVLLEDQDRGRWDGKKIAEGSAVLEGALHQDRVGPYQLQAMIAACHASAASVDTTDWAQILALYNELLSVAPSPVVSANRAVAIGMGQGPAAGLDVIERLLASRDLERWAPLHVARAGFLERLGREGEAVAAYRRVLALGAPSAEREFIAGRIADLTEEGQNHGDT